jgi:hypothetical protein
LKYPSHSSLPKKVLAKNGSRERDHSGPCSVILGALPKYCDRSSEGGGGEINARQKECVVFRNVVLCVEDMTCGSFSVKDLERR